MPALFDKVLRAGEGKILRKLAKTAETINLLEEDYVDLTDAELREETDKFKQRYQDGDGLDDILWEAFAVVREAAKRTIGQRHYDVQLMGGAALHWGNIAEMRTGEGKTLVGTLPAYLNAITGDGVHIITTNDYLAERDSEWMGRIHRFLGLDVGVILASMTPAQRKVAYGADITYGTNNEFGFDYLRDNMAWSKEELVQRGHNFAIVDEVDSILIDEARTPLIISGPSDQATKWYTDFAKIVNRLVKDTDYEVDEKKKTVGVMERGVERVEDLLGIDNLYESVNTPLVGFLNNAIKAKELFKKDRDYVVMNGEILIVDEHTGRILAGRRYNEGMHQAIEAKEGVVIQNENQTLATITLQNYFRLYAKLSGMTGTALTEAAEFHQIYKLGVVPIPTNKPMVRKDQQDLIYISEEAKFKAVVEDIEHRNAEGQPILVGTVSVEKSEYLSQQLRKRGVPHEVLNAKYHEREAQIVAQAGRKGAVTVATNMAGRGTDIMLGGNPENLATGELAQRGLTPGETPEEYEDAWPAALEKAKKAVAAEHDEVEKLGGLYVLGTERHESRRIDNQLRGRAGRQGDPGESRFYLSLGDDLMRLFKAQIVERVLAVANVGDDVPIESKMVTRAIQSAQTQLEQQNFEIRKNVLKYDDVINKQREVIYAERRRVLDGEDLRDHVRHMMEDTVRAYVAAATAEGYAEEWELEKLWSALATLYPISITLDEVEEAVGGGRTGITAQVLVEEITADILGAYDKREANLGDSITRELERRVVLSVLDRRWREHLYEMDYLQEGIGLRAMAQRDPLVEYQREGYLMFQGMMEGIKEESVGYLFNLEVQVEANSEDPEAQAQAQAATAQLNAKADATAQLNALKGLEAPKRPARLNYSAPTVDGAGGVVERQEANTSAAGPQDAAPKPKPKGRPPAPGGRRRKK